MALRGIECDHRVMKEMYGVLNMPYSNSQDACAPQHSKKFMRAVGVNFSTPV